MISEQELEQYENIVREAQLQTQNEKMQNLQQEIMLNSNDKSMIKEQLDLGEELDRIDYLLRGYTIERNDETGESRWVKPDNNDMIILSDYGVHLIRNTIAWYLNKNTLLSNYDEDTINNKMEDFSSDLNDTIFMEYEKVFKFPSFADCKIELDNRIAKKKEIKIYVLELMGKRLTDKEKQDIEDKILKELEPIIARELEKIKQQTIKNKLKRFMLIIREVQDAVHSTYLRAWNGQERKTLREHIHISETKGGMIMPQAKTTANPLSWFKRR